MVKRILICRDRARSGDMERAFRNRGFHCVFFSTFQFRELPDSGEIQSAFKNMETTDALIFSSVFGVRFFHKKQIRLRPELSSKDFPATIAVGRKTADRFQKLFPETEIVFVAENLQAALNYLPTNSSGHRSRVLHFTSKQSLHNISPLIPENVVLQRLPIYETVRDDSHSETEIGEIRERRFEVIFFGSPTAFDYFLNLAGEKPLRSARLLAAMGKTTAAHVAAAGFPNPVTPERPEAEQLAEAVENYLSRNGATQVSMERK